MRNLATTAALPAQEAITALWFWLRTRWAESRAWRVTAVTLSAVVVLTICHVVNIASARADDGGGASATTFFLDLAKQTDTHGIGVWRYTTLPLDYGQGTAAARIVRGIVLGICWLFYTVVLFMILALVQFILGFTWLQWLLSPVILLTNVIRDLFNQAGIMTLGLSISALVIAFGFLRGKKSAAIVEFFAVVIIFGIATAPAITNPTQLFQGQGSWIQNSRDYGVEAGNLTVQGKAGAPAISGNPISASIIDQTLRRPTLYIAFGSQLSAECAAKFDAKMLDGTDAEGIRNEVTGCSDAAKKANETDDWNAFGVLGIFAIGTLAIMFLVGVFVFFIIKDATLAVLGFVNVAIRAHLAVFPGGGRYAFINAFFQMIVNIVMIALYIWMLSAYLFLANLIMAAIPESSLVMGNFIFGIVILVMVFTFFKLKRSGKSVASMIAKALGKTGLSSPSVPRQPSNLAKSTRRIGERWVGNKLGLGKKGGQSLRQPGQRFVQQQAGSPSGVPRPSGKGPASLARLALAAGSAATTGGTSLALQVASAAAGHFGGGGGSSAGTGSADGVAGMVSGVVQAAATGKGSGSVVRTLTATGIESGGQQSTEGAGVQPAASRGGSGPRYAGPGTAKDSSAPLEGRIVDRVPSEARRIPVFQFPEHGRRASQGPARQGAGLVRQQPQSMSGMVRV
jgi:hypothetical protein